jgi:hypothetical protein
MPLRLCEEMIIESNGSSHASKHTLYASICQRSALSNVPERRVASGPLQDGVIKLPGLELVPLRGPGQLPGDKTLGDSAIFWASQPRSLLEKTRQGCKAPADSGRPQYHMAQVRQLPPNAWREDNPVPLAGRAVVESLDRTPGGSDASRRR